MEIWLNPACSKCRTAVDTLDEAGVTYTVRRYLEDTPSAEEIRAVLDRLGLEPWDITRAKEAKQQGVDQLPRDVDHRADWIDVLASSPRLIQRPIITADDGTTVVGRTPEALQQVVDAEQS